MKEEIDHSQDSDTLREWRESAPYWEKHREVIRAMFDPITQALIEEAGIVAGQSVLDVAGGPGEPSLTISEVVGLSGLVVCTDGVAEMVAAAESAAQRLGRKNMRFHQCTAEWLPFDSNSFDTVISRLGVMFFPDALATLREMLRVIKPGGTISLAVWHKSEANPYAHRVTEVIDRHLETPPVDADALGAFRFAERGKLAAILTEAGAIDVYERLLQFRMEAPISFEEFWILRSEISETLREKLKRLTPQQVSRVTTEVSEAVGEFFPNGKLCFPAEIIVVTGTKNRTNELLETD
jgi:ubiquinone/menaquinone biosynthesis C-methylase UbiE